MRDEQLLLSALLEEYKVVSEEIKLYLRQMFICLPYAAILAALHLGWGSTGSAGASARIREYLPYGFVLLVVYFVAISYIRVGLSRYRAQLEGRINDVIGEEALMLDSQYMAMVQSRGFVQLGRAWYARVPTPLLLLGVLVAAGGWLLFGVQSIGDHKWIIVAMLFIAGIIFLCVFLVYPRLIDRAVGISRRETRRK